MAEADFHWQCRHTWAQSARNTAWCLLGCSIGDFGAILLFQLYAPQTSPLIVMSVAIVAGLVTSILLETAILMRQMPFAAAARTAVGMSMVSMISMEVAMNATDYLLVGEAALRWWTIPPMLVAGFVTPWPYNYWRLKKHGVACH